MPTQGPAADTTTQITISGGNPTNNSVTIPSNQLITVSNSDNVAYLIKLFTTGNDHHIAIAVYLPALGSFQFEATPGEAANTKCYYDVLPVTPRPIGGSGGNNVIIIGSSTPR